MGRMTNDPSTTDVREIRSVDASRRQTRLLQALFAGAATVAAFVLFSTAKPGDAGTAVASGSAPGITVVPVDDTNFVNDQGQTSGDIFTQNAQDQSTA
jgi:hypothetical protein